jgi:glycerol uptake facilitator-like aquaporin
LASNQRFLGGWYFWLSRRWSEFVLTFGLLAVIVSSPRSHRAVMLLAATVYITITCWFMVPASFANPAALALSDTLFTG